MSLEVLDPGPLTTVQDRGRRGWAHLGVPRGGVLDRAAASLANRLVGNDEDAAVLETTLGGVVLRAGRALTFAVTGAPASISVDDRPVSHASPVSVMAGAVIRVGAADRGVRSYVALGGGITVAPVLGSRSTDTLSWTGPPRLAVGQVLPLGPATIPPRGVDFATTRPGSVEPITLSRGPRADWVPEEAWSALAGACFTVGQDSDRIGLRLTGSLVPRARTGEVASEGIITGAVQLPPSGEPVIFLADHPTTGGYPVIALVDDVDLDRCGQLRPGDQVRLRVR